MRYYLIKSHLIALESHHCAVVLAGTLVVVIVTLKLLIIYDLYKAHGFDFAVLLLSVIWLYNLQKMAYSCNGRSSLIYVSIIHM